MFEQQGLFGFRVLQIQKIVENIVFLQNQYNYLISYNLSNYIREAFKIIYKKKSLKKSQQSGDKRF